LYVENKVEIEKGMEDLLNKTLVLTGITAILYVVLFYFCDRAIDLWIHNNYASGRIHQYGSYISDLVKGEYIRLALALGFMFIVIYDPGLKKHGIRNLLYICVCGSIAIIIGEGWKYLLGRYRPIMLFEHNLYGMQFFASKWALNSTPSGHTVRAFSILTALSLVYRRFAVIFLSVALLIGVSRVAVTAHYPSDVLFGAFIGIFTAIWIFRYFFGRADEYGKNLPRLKRP
jgi:membrane-associated phospholipid phosphatase